MNTMEAAGIILSEEELVRITDYKPPHLQLKVLHDMGFHRARRSKRTGRIILERTHYEAVTAGRAQAKEPQLRPSLRAA